MDQEAKTGAATIGWILIIVAACYVAVELGGWRWLVPVALFVIGVAMLWATR